jgi:predicted Zn-dependent protease
VAAVLVAFAALPPPVPAQLEPNHTGGIAGTAANTSAAQPTAQPSTTSIDAPAGPAMQPGPALARPVAPTRPSRHIQAGKKEHGTKKHLSAEDDVTKIGERNVGGGLNFYSIAKERALGKQLAMQVESSSRLLTDPVVTAYVNRIGQNIVRNSDAKVPFTIKVIDDDDVNAFALPGGYFYVNTGLILAAENEAELAGVMAHEIAHVAARHATKNATRSEIFNLASIPLIFVGGPAGFAIEQIAGLAVPMSFLKFSRDAEREADLLGLQYEYAAGYDPAEFVHFFETIKAREKRSHSILAKAFATHPMTSDRIKRAQKEIETMLPSRPEYIVNTSEFDEVKARLEADENAQRISSAGNVLPTLRRRPPEDDSKTEGDGRPTLKRRPQ